MNILFHAGFKKNYKKLIISHQKQCDERLLIFMENPYNLQLNNHALHGKYKGCRSIRITGDLRAVYQLVSENASFFIALDTHSNLYS